MSVTPLAEGEKRRLEAQCAEYLGGMPGGPLLLEALRDKFASIGRMGGVVVLETLTREEADFLRSLLARPVPMVAAAIKASEIDKSFVGTRFEGVSLQGVLEAYFSAPLTTRKAVRRDQKSLKTRFFEALAASSGSEELKTYLVGYLKAPESGCFRLVTLLYNASPERLGGLMRSVDNALAVLSRRKTPVTLPVLSALATQNPHAFDEGTDLHKLLLQVLFFEGQYCNQDGILSEDGSVAVGLKNAEARGELLYKWGIINDTGHRTVMTYGLVAYAADGVALGWEGFALRREPLVVGMQNMAAVAAIGPLKQDAAKVYCFENPSVFQYAVAAAPEIAAVCTKGQLNLMAWTLLDRLTDSGLRLVYSGDFDPEGLMIAQRLKRRYGARLEWLCYDLECYAAALSEVGVDDRRLAQLLKLEDPALVRVAEEMRRVRRAGYEELILGEILKRMG